MRLPLRSTPQLSSIDTEIFELRYFAKCMDCTFCYDSCCQYGADVNVGERDRILAEAGSLTSLIPYPKEEWFTSDVKADPEYPSGHYVRSQVRDGACVFLNRKGRGCLLHAWAIQQGRDFHEIKPLVCTLFPVIYDQGVLRAAFDVKHGLVCAEQGLTVYRSAREELALFFGQPLVEELDAYEAEHAGSSLVSTVGGQARKKA